jgi:hypothetical protein
MPSQTQLHKTQLRIMEWREKTIPADGAGADRLIVV